MAKLITLDNLSRFKSDYDTYVAGLIASAVASSYKYKGTATVAQINALTTRQVGDVYNVLDSGTVNPGSVSVVAGDNVAWNGSSWDKLAGSVDLSNYYTSTQVDTLLGGYLPLSAGNTKVLTGVLHVKPDENGGISANGDLLIKSTSGGDAVILQASSIDIKAGSYAGRLMTSNLTAQRDYQFPNKGGIIALTDDIPNLSSYLPLSAGSLAKLTGPLYVKDGSSGDVGIKSSGDLYIATTSSGDEIFLNVPAGSVNITSGSYYARLQTTNLTAQRDIQFPNEDGTLVVGSIATNSDVDALFA